MMIDEIIHPSRSLEIGTPPDDCGEQCAGFICIRPLNIMLELQFHLNRDEIKRVRRALKRVLEEDSNG